MRFLTLLFLLQFNPSPLQIWEAEVQAQRQADIQKQAEISAWEYEFNQLTLSLNKVIQSLNAGKIDIKAWALTATSRAERKTSCAAFCRPRHCIVLH